MGRWLDALKKHENAPNANPQKYQKSDLANFDTFETAKSADLEEKLESAASDQRKPIETGKHEEPLLAGQSNEKTERRRIIPFPGREWTPDAKIRSDDPEIYLEALRLHGPMSYGMAMRVLQWGGTRAGRAEDALLEQVRIKFNERGWAYPVDSSEE
jgi:hypothetical protein